MPEVARRAVVDGPLVNQTRSDGGPGPSMQGPRGLLADELFAVLVLWDPDEPGTWRGWLTTITHRAASFCARDLEDSTFRRRLAELPGWEPRRLSVALGRPGFHLVWRHPDR